MESKIKWYILGGFTVGILLILILLFGTNLNHRFMMGDNSTGNMNGMGNMHGNGGNGMMRHGANIDLATSSEPPKPLPIPPELKPDRETEGAVYYTVRAEQGETQFFANGKRTPTLGYNGNLLGPMIKLPKGKTVYIDTVNRLAEPTTFHWHGLKIPSKEDGGPHQPVKQGEQRRVRLDIEQEAATLWFHPHPMGSTAKQVYQGLAGLLYVTEEGSEIDLPHEYGVDDIPIIVQDRLFERDGTLNYDNSMNADGTVGDTLIANGAINTEFDVERSLMRVRLVNGSNARNFEFSLSGGETFTQIASDGGLLEEPVSLDRVALSPGERAEILIDFSKNEVGDEIELQANGIPVNTFVIKGLEKSAADLEGLKEKSSLNRKSSEVDRRLTLFGMGNMVTIDGKRFDPDRIDIEVKRGVTEVWEIYNEKDMMGGMTHPFHIHGVQFRILERDGKVPSANEKGWKDTVAVTPGERVKIAIEFNEEGTFMYHCHNLEHEENGMMGQLKVTP
ncbi:multicopper oxidase family protein [Exiguobacterium flavidum]|uniref:multicopper oxidase family protein n=1 Tax=Exiguobacterium flavidum TaxID=2184695 RepID=UPI000DF7CDF0|nr:multicopper oxidase domain-containing protein [Exiguobacterium flavidum]